MNIKTAQAMGKATSTIKNLGNALQGGDIKSTGISSINDAHANINKMNPIERAIANVP